MDLGVSENISDKTILQMVPSFTTGFPFLGSFPRSQSFWGQWTHLCPLSSSINQVHRLQQQALVTNRVWVKALGTPIIRWLVHVITKHILKYLKSVVPIGLKFWSIPFLAPDIWWYMWETSIQTFFVRWVSLIGGPWQTKPINQRWFQLRASFIVAAVLPLMMQLAGCIATAEDRR